MKKRWIGFIAILLCLSGCGGKETTTVCRGDVDGMEDVMTLVASGDKVTVSTEEVIIKFADFEVESAEDKEFFTALMKEQFSDMEENDGVTVETEVTEETLTIRVSFDMTKVDYDTLVALGFAEATSDQKINYISLKDSIQGFEESGFTCETK